MNLLQKNKFFIISHLLSAEILTFELCPCWGANINITARDVTFWICFSLTAEEVLALCQILASS